MTQRAGLPTVVIVGRPNVGKSTLFNRLIGKKLALVDDRPGVTRDRREGEGHLLGLDFRIVDTAGFEEDDPASLPGRMRAQTEAAVHEADVALFLIDARAGLTPVDEEIARWLRDSDTPIIVAANKAAKQMGAPPFAIPFSAEEKIGSEALLTRIGQIVEDAQAAAVRQTSVEAQEMVFTAESPE